MRRIHLSQHRWRQIRTYIYRFVAIYIAALAVFYILLSHAQSTYASYEIYWEETTEYACTCQMSKKCFPELYNHRLNTICSYLDISLDHHNAGSDARACAMILIKCLERGISVDSFKRRYDVIGARTIREEKPSARRYPAAKKRTKF